MEDGRKLPWWVLGLVLVGSLVLGIVIVRGLWLSFQFGLWSLADSLAKELAKYIPLNQGYLTALTLVFFVALIPLTALVLSFSKKNRKVAVIAGSLGLAVFYAVIGYASSGFKINPISGAPAKCYSLFNGKVTYHDLVPGQERQFDPETGRPCIAITPEIAVKLSRFEHAIVPQRIPADIDVEPDMFDRALGTPLVWYFRSADGVIELFDNEGFHPDTSVALLPVTSEVVEIWREHRRRLLAARKKAEEEREREEQALRDRRQKAEELQREQEQQARIEQQRLEKERLAAGNDCDRLAGNAFDRDRNPQFPGVPYQLLAVNAAAAVKSCQVASEQSPGTVRYRYQLGRSLQATGSPQAKSVMGSLVQDNYPAAFDNLGWLLVRERKASQAIGLFRHGAALGNAEAMVSLAGFLIEGKWVQKNEREAIRLLTSAAELGHPQAVEAVAKYEEQKRMGALGMAIFGTILLEALKR